MKYINYRWLFLVVCFFISFLLLNCSEGGDLEEKNLTWKLHIIDSTLWGADGIRVGYFNADSKLDYISGGEEIGISRVYLGQDGGVFTTIDFLSKDVEDAIYLDVNQDGLTEVMTMCEGENKAIYLHYLEGDNTWTTQKLLASAGKNWMYAAKAPIKTSSSMEMVVGGKGEEAILGWIELENDFANSANWRINEIAKVGWIMSIEILDMDGDGDKDVIVSDRKGDNSGVKWYENPGGALIESPWKEHAMGLIGKEVMFMDMLDFDQDGDHDFLVSEIHDGIYLLSNPGNTNDNWMIDQLFSYPERAGKRGKSVVGGDLNNDGQIEIYTSYEEAEGLMGVIGSFKDVNTGKWEHQDIGGLKGIKYDKLVLNDCDSDGDLDLMTTEEREGEHGLGVVWYENPLQ